MMTTTVRSFIPNLPRRAWTVLAGDTFSALGSGLVLPFLIVYLHEVRHLSLAIAGLAVSTLAVSSLVVSPIAGYTVDRLGARRTLVFSLCVSALASVGIALIRETWHAFAAAALFGVGISAMWPAIHSTLMSLVEPHQRSSVFSVHYATLNAGLGLGGIVGGLLVDVTRPETFELVYTLDALTFLAFALMLMRMKDVGVRVTRTDAERREAGGYRDVFGDRVFLRVVGLMTLLVMIGYSQLESGFPAFVRAAGVSTTALGLAFGANTLTIVLAQLVVLKKLEGRRRTRALSVLCLLWMGAWTVTLLSGTIAGFLAPFGFAFAMVLFALGETLVSPTVPAIINDLAPESLRGRYNAMYSLSFSLGHVVGPAIAGLVLGAGFGGGFFAALIVLCLGAAWLSLRLDRYLPAGANRISSQEPEAAPIGTGPEVLEAS